MIILVLGFFMKHVFVHCGFIGYETKLSLPSMQYILGSMAV